MSILTAQSLHKSYGAQDVLHGVTIAVPRGARIALVGQNGIGKTTLLRIITGVESPDQGQVHRSKSLRIGYLPQEAGYSKSKKQDLRLTLWESSLQAFHDLVNQEAELERLEKMMSDPKKADTLLKRYGELQEAFELAGGYVYPHRIRQVLNGFGFSPLEYRKRLDDFSGGEKTRAFFARLLLDNPQLLVLDEPTNHLDIGSVEWLEGWLADWEGSCIIVSHDRYFLDQTVDTVWDLDRDGVTTYRGNYSAYMSQRAQRREYRKKQYRSQQEFIQKEEEYIRRNIAGQNTRQAQGRRKRLQRLLRDEAVERPSEDKHVRIDFGNIRRSGNVILETEGFGILHPEEQRILFSLPDMVLPRGERVVVMGPNGSGKTTFLNTLLGENDSYVGSFKLGASLKISYFAQGHEDLTPHRSVIEEVTLASHLKEREARHFLATFLFRGDDVFKRVDSLSGGERGRLSLAKLILQDANLLLLDEPTNHLDIPSQEVLEEALINFPETIILVSHDRYLIDRLATQLWVINPEDSTLKIYEGGYSEYVKEQGRRSGEDSEERRKKRIKKGSRKGPVAEEISLEEVEEMVAFLEKELGDISEQLMEAGDDFTRVRALSERYAVLEQDLQQQLELWERFASAQPGA